MTACERTPAEELLAALIEWRDAPVVGIESPGGFYFQARHPDDCDAIGTTCGTLGPAGRLPREDRS